MAQLVVPKSELTFLALQLCVPSVSLPGISEDWVFSSCKFERAPHTPFNGHYYY